MKQNKASSCGIRWKIFLYMLIPSFLLLFILWLIQTVFFGVFYAHVKTDELKRSAETVVSNINKSDIKDTILLLAGNGDVNISVIDTEAFENVYTSGDDITSVTNGWGAYSMYKLYEDTEKNGGEYVRYYSADAEYEQMPEKDEEPKDAPDNVPSYDREPDKPFGRESFHRIPSPGIFDHIGKKNLLLYSKTAYLSDGTEIMVVADSRLTPLNSTVSTLRRQLGVCTLVSVISSLVLSFLISKKVSSPIEKLNKAAKKLADGNFEANFQGTGYREIEQLSDTLNFASREIGKTEALRRELMANVSHDMRTPLTMIVGYSEVMRDIPGENTPENVQVIIDEANRLSEFVNSVLDLTKLQSGMERIETEITDLRELVKNTAERYSRLLSQETCAVELKIPDEPTYANCDVMKITQALHNLADNAVNYAKDPKKISLSLERKHDGFLRVEIADNGEGINPNELPYIWDRYYKTSKSHKRNTVGSGIGLSIVKEIFDLHGARYGVETSGGGSVFWFELPEVENNVENQK